MYTGEINPDILLKFPFLKDRVLYDTLRYSDDWIKVDTNGLTVLFSYRCAYESDYKTPKDVRYYPEFLGMGTPMFVYNSSWHLDGDEVLNYLGFGYGDKGYDAKHAYDILYKTKYTKIDVNVFLADMFN